MVLVTKAFRFLKVPTPSFTLPTHPVISTRTIRADNISRFLCPNP